MIAWRQAREQGKAGRSPSVSAPTKPRPRRLGCTHINIINAQYKRLQSIQSMYADIRDPNT